MAVWMMMMLSFSGAHAQVPAVVTPTSHQDLDVGDEAWSNGLRQDAKSAWLLAAESPDPAVRAMAEVRLVLVSGSLGMAIHGPRSESALAECFSVQTDDKHKTANDPWCALAAADLVLVQHQVGIPTDLELAIDAAESVTEALPAPAAARLVWAGALSIDDLPPATDGLGTIMERHGEWPEGPGTWTLNLGPVAAPGMGTGGVLRFVHPDVAWRGWMLKAAALATNQGFATLDLSLAAQSRMPWGASIQVSQQRVDLYDTTGCIERLELRGLQARPWIGTHMGSIVVYGGPLFRADTLMGSNPEITGHGAHVSVGTRRELGPAQLSLFNHMETSLSSYTYGSTTLDLRLTATHLALQLRGDASGGIEAPAWRGPAYGGGRVLRAVPLGRLRAPLMAAAVLEWRQSITPLLGLAFFAESAWANSLHMGGGTGFRLQLPPRPHNTLRLDVATNGNEWTLNAGWGEAF